MNTIPGNNYEFSQPIEMRFNELISGVRADVAVKIFGDDLGVMAQTSEEIEKVLAAGGLAKTTRGVQEAVEIAMGGKEAGTLFEGDRRFPIVVRLPEQLRSNIDAMRRIPIPLPKSENKGEKSKIIPVATKTDASTPGVAFIPLGELAEFKVEPGLNQVNRENGKRRIVTTANVRGRAAASELLSAK